MFGLRQWPGMSCIFRIMVWIPPASTSSQRKPKIGGGLKKNTTKSHANYSHGHGANRHPHLPPGFDNAKQASITKPWDHARSIASLTRWAKPQTRCGSMSSCRFIPTPRSLYPITPTQPDLSRRGWCQCKERLRLGTRQSSCRYSMANVDAYHDMAF